MIYLIDSANANKVVGKFTDFNDAEDYMWQKHLNDNREPDDYFSVTDQEMKDAVYKYGSRKLNYWT